MAEVSGLILLDHVYDAAVDEDGSRVDQAVEHLSGLLGHVGLVRVVLQFIVRLQIKDLA